MAKNFRHYLNLVTRIDEDNPETLDLEPSNTPQSDPFTFSIQKSDGSSVKVDGNANISGVLLSDADSIQKCLQTAIRASLLNYVRKTKDSQLPVDAQQIGSIPVVLGAGILAVSKLPQAKGVPLQKVISSIVEFWVAFSGDAEKIVVDFNPEMKNKLPAILNQQK